jgi:phosphopantetheinyl transferase (holo-ACP synthase)
LVLISQPSEDLKDPLNPCQKFYLPMNYLAGRWAAKEAVFKAAGLNNAIILSHSNGSPYVKDREDIVVSISHERAYAVAVAVQKT